MSRIPRKLPEMSESDCQINSDVGAMTTGALVSVALVQPLSTQAFRDRPRTGLWPPDYVRHSEQRFKRPGSIAVAGIVSTGTRLWTLRSPHCGPRSGPSTGLTGRLLGLRPAKGLTRRALISRSAKDFSASFMAMRPASSLVRSRALPNG